jgi:hypothetical protein
MSRQKRPGKEKNFLPELFKKLLQLPLNVWSKIKNIHGVVKLSADKLFYSTITFSSPKLRSLFMTVFQHNWALQRHSSI